MAIQRVSLTFPGRWADDARYTVAFEESAFPRWPISFHYLLIGTDDGDAKDWFLVGVEVGSTFRVQPRSDLHRLEGPLPKRRGEPDVLRYVADNFVELEQLARRQLEPGAPVVRVDELVDRTFDMPSVVAAKPRRRRRRMTEGFLELIAEQYEQYTTRDNVSPLKELAKDYAVNPSTVSRWLAKARSRA
jgi:hypothetical protein